MNRLYVVECSRSLTGAQGRPPAAAARPARSRLRPRLAAELGVAGRRASGEPGRRPAPWVTALAADLQTPPRPLHRPRRGRPAAAVHALAHAINHPLGNVGKTVRPTSIRSRRRPTDDAARWVTELVDDMEAGRVEVLLHPRRQPGLHRAGRPGVRASTLQRRAAPRPPGLYQDETARAVPLARPRGPLPGSWGDARAFDGTASIVQPLIAPLYGGRSAHEVLAAFVSARPNARATRSCADLLARTVAKGVRRRRLRAFWQTPLHDGFIAGSAFAHAAVTVTTRGLGGPAHRRHRRDGRTGWRSSFGPDPTIYDGRFANNGWLQELPKPLTKLTWDNAAFVSPATAQELGLTQTFGNRTAASTAGNHRTVVELRYGDRTVRAPVWIVPGHADDSVTVHLGYGRTRGGHGRHRRPASTPTSCALPPHPGSATA